MISKELSLLQCLIVTRHGSYRGGRLDSYGHQQMRELGDALEHIISSPVQILSSSAVRCRESAEVLASHLDVPHVETFECLWSGEDSPWSMPYGDMPSVHELVLERRKSARGLVLVTHLEVSNEYPRYFTKKEFDISLQFDELPRGQAYFFDLTERIWCILPAKVAVYKL